MLFFTTNDQGQASIFKNVFCALCADEPNVVAYMCNNSQFLIERSDRIPFAMILDTSLSEIVSEEEISPHCSPMEVYDYVKVMILEIIWQEMAGHRAGRDGSPTYIASAGK